MCELNKREFNMIRVINILPVKSPSIINTNYNPVLGGFIPVQAHSTFSHFLIIKLIDR